MADKPYKQENIDTTGRLITSVDPTQLGRGDFQELSNMRYTNTGIRSIKGMTKVNTVAVTDPVIQSMHHFVKNQPAESHLIVQAKANAADTTSILYDNTTAIPNQGNFSSLYSEQSGASAAMFSPAPDGCMAACDGKENLIWGGAEARCAGFRVASHDDAPTIPTTMYEYTEKVINWNTTDVALIKQRYVHIASTRKLKGVKLYSSVANTAAATVAVKYWDGSAWQAVTNLVDGTAVAGKTLAQTGSISFDSTVSVANVRFFDNTVLYWYLFDFNGVDATTAIYHCSVDAPIQPLTDIWDGVPHQIASFKIYDGTRYDDWSANVFEKDFVYGAQTYADIHDFATTRHFVVGFTRRMQGVRVNLGRSPYSGNYNTAAATLSVKYWNGTAWTSMTVKDGTSDGGASFNRDGTITWYPPDSTSEFKRSFDYQDLFYYYQFSFNATLVAAKLTIDYMEGIPTQVDVPAYRFPVMFQGRLVLCNNINDTPNTALLSASNTNNVFNGKDSLTLYFGDEKALVAGAPFYSRFSNAFFENLLVCKSDSVWIVDGDSADTYRVRKVSNLYGCAAPATLIPCDIGFATANGADASRHTIIWQSASAIIMWDGSTLYPIHTDIEDVFDQTKTNCIEPSMISSSSAFFDEANREYHWLWASSGNTTLNMESVFDVIRRKWYTINRGTGNKLQLGASVMDTNNNRYAYGAIDTGFVLHLENGQTQNSTAITSAWHSGDIPLGGWMIESQVRHIKPYMKAKNTTTNTLTIDYYADSASSVTKSNTFTVGNSTGRLAKPTTPVSSDSLPMSIFHSFKCTMSTSNEDYCFEPTGLGILYKLIREEVK